MGDIWHDVSWVVPYRNEGLTTIFEAFTWLGYPAFVMLFLPLGYWLWNKNKFTRLTAVVILATLLNAFLKDYWQNPRPDAVFRLDPGVGDSYGMPSGHAQISAVLWFGLAYEIKRSWAWIVAGVIVSGIAFSRVYLGIHDLEDIVVGLALALACLLTYRLFLSESFIGFGSWPLWTHLLIISIGFAILIYSWPTAGHSYDAISLVGFLGAWLVGANLDKRYIKFEPREGWKFIPIAAVVGLLGLIAVLVITKPVFNLIDPAYTKYLRTILLGIYMTAGAPLLFKLLKLHRPSKSSVWRT
jgi:membrane-associated phospholipid phosphatase